MANNTQLLELQIQRLLLDKSSKERLVKELQAASDEEMSLLVQLVREHDDEALLLLNEKVKEQSVAKAELGSMADGKQPDPAEKKELLRLLGEVFKDPKRMAQFLAYADELILAEMEEIFVKALQKHPEQQQDFREFFREVRLQKSAFQNQWAEKKREKLIQEVVAKRAMAKQLREAIVSAEKILKKAK
ncbi:MAG: hypothetical protein Q8P95_00780 [bacterium]|nr:hypothetical protein [bacterium]